MLFWIFGITLGVSGIGAGITYVLTYVSIRNPNYVSPPSLLVPSVLAVIFAVSGCILIGLVLAKNRL